MRDLRKGLASQNRAVPTYAGLGVQTPSAAPACRGRGRRLPGPRQRVRARARNPLSESHPTLSGGPGPRGADGMVSSTAIFLNEI